MIVSQIRIKNQQRRVIRNLIKNTEQPLITIMMRPDRSLNSNFRMSLKGEYNYLMSHQHLQTENPVDKYAQLLGLDYEVKLRRLLLHTYTRLLDNFRQAIYDPKPIRQAAREYLNGVIVHELQQVQQQNHIIGMISQVCDELGMYFWIVLRAPGIWTQLIDDEEILAEDNVMDLYTFISRVYKRLMQVGEQHMPGLFETLSSLLQKELFYYLELVANEVSHIYNVYKKLVVEEIDELNSDTKTMRLINKYIVYKMLRELSMSILVRIKDGLRQSLFQNVEPEIIDSFAGYILRTHDILSMVSTRYAKSHSQGKTLEDQFKEKIILLSSHMKRVSYREAVREDGKKAVYMEFEQELEAGKDGRISSCMAQIDCNGRVVFNSPSLMSKEWKLLDRKDKADLQDLLENRSRLVQTMKGAPHQVQKVNLNKSLQTVGGSLGNCLANINRYDSLEGFLGDFSRKAVIASSLNILIERLPLLGYFMISVGFTYSFYSILNDDFKNTGKKIKDIRNVVIGTGTSLGAGLVGGLVGSAFIPIPVLGMFVGSVVGGFIGGITSNSLIQFLQSSQLSGLVDHLMCEVGEHGEVRASPSILKRLGVKQDVFYDTIPVKMQNKLGCDIQWLTMISFVLVSFEQVRLSKELTINLAGRQRNARVAECLQKMMRYSERERIAIRTHLKDLEQFLGSLFQAV